MKISIASDHAGFEQKQALVGYLASKGHDVIDRGPDCDDRVDYPDYAARVAHDVVDGMAERGVLVCGTGIGMAVAANKIDGIRAANVTSPLFAALARERRSRLGSLRRRVREPRDPRRFRLHLLRRRSSCRSRREDRRSRKRIARTRAARIALC